MRDRGVAAIADVEFDVSVVGGLGHVGLPLGISLASLGKRVVLYDVNEDAGQRVRAGEMPFLENGASEVLRQVIGKSLFVSTDAAVIAASKYVVVTIGTPLDEHLNAKAAVLRRCLDDLFQYIRDDHHIVLRSTLFPGTTERTLDHLKRRGRHTRVSCCPERIAQGYAMAELRSLPQIVGALDRATAEEAAELFRTLTQDIVFTTPLEAELGKLFTNTWRYLEFAIANQFYQIATERGVDFNNIYHAITHDYPRAKHFPGAGFAAGPCLFKDTMQLAAFSNNGFSLGHAGMLINEGLPNFVVQQLASKMDLSTKVVGVLGMAFKPNNDDKRESLAYKLRKLVELEARAVWCTDVYIKDPTFVSAEELIERSDVIIVATPHREYEDLVFRAETRIVDIWNFYGRRMPSPSQTESVDCAS